MCGVGVRTARDVLLGKEAVLAVEDGRVVVQLRRLPEERRHRTGQRRGQPRQQRARQCRV